MTTDNLKTIFAARLAEILQAQPEITPEKLAETLLKTGIVSERRLRQYCAVCEFYKRYESKQKNNLLSELSVKYDVSERLLKEITTCERRFVV